MATVRYLVEDVERAVATYTAAFGFELIEQFGPAFALMRREDLSIWLSGPPSSAARTLDDGTKPGPGGWNRFVLQTDDIVALIASVEAAGVTMRNPIVRGPGGAQALANDGEGNVVELFQPL